MSILDFIKGISFEYWLTIGALVVIVIVIIVGVILYFTGTLEKIPYIGKYFAVKDTYVNVTFQQTPAFAYPLDGAFPGEDIVTDATGEHGAYCRLPGESGESICSSTDYLGMLGKKAGPGKKSIMRSKLSYGAALHQEPGSKLLLESMGGLSILTKKAKSKKPREMDMGLSALFN